MERSAQRTTSPFVDHGKTVLNPTTVSLILSSMKVSKWESFREDTPISQRQSYISAVKCLHSLPSKSDPALVPGARNRLDDFTYAHINQTNFIHESVSLALAYELGFPVVNAKYYKGWFLPWHRVFVHSYEIALQTECNYNGTQPYWDWASFSDDQTKSALFDGSDTSIGGNGEAVAHPNQTGIIPGLPTPIPVTRPAGTGGGCVTDGPFAQPTFTVNIGPVSPIVPGYMSQPSSNDTYGTQYNPRCLKRDFLPSLSAGNLSWANVTDLMETPDIHSFRPTLEGSMHPSAHSSIGADLFDLFSSPSDPAFFFLHSQIDRLWTVWQGQDPATRTNGLDGTTTFVNGMFALSC